MKLRGIVEELINSNTGTGGDLSGTLVTQVEQIIDNRLAELTPQKVRRIVEDMIREHLGWLVVWGGIFGGLIGLVMAVIARL